MAISNPSIAEAVRLTPMRCKSRAKIEEYLQSHPIYMVSSQSIVSPDASASSFYVEQKPKIVDYSGINTA